MRFRDFRQTFYKGFVKSDFPKELIKLIEGEEERPKLDATPRMLAMAELGFRPAENRASRRSKVKPEKEPKSNKKHYIQSQIRAERKANRVGKTVSKYRKGRGTYDHVVVE